MTVMHFILYITIQREDVSELHESTGDRLGRQEKVKQGNLWDWIKCKMIDTNFFYTGGYRVVNSQQLT